jgi:two-component system, chemotaxis family, protein-glutamate methylesterase/glutaminase
MNKTRVLIVDDSSTMRLILRTVLAPDPEIEVVGAAGDALEARNMIKALNPDVLTLDVEMPNMSGIEFLHKIMALRPMPVVMISTLTARGSQSAVQALEIGAVDCVGKPTAEYPNSFEGLAEKLKAAARARVGGANRALPRDGSAAAKDYSPSDMIVAVGASTGGVEALQTVLTGLPANCPPIVVTQHMPPTFTKTLAQRLDRICAPTVKEAQQGDVCRPGQVLIAPGGEAHLEISGSGTFHCALKRASLVNGHCPSVDVLFGSVARHAKSKAIGVILTGMGNDGAQGLLAIRRAGAKTLGQDETSSVVYGMPKSAFEIGAVEAQLPLQKIASEILRLTQSTTPGATKCLLPNT